MPSLPRWQRLLLPRIKSVAFAEMLYSAAELLTNLLLLLTATVTKESLGGMEKEGERTLLTL